MVPDEVWQDLHFILTYLLGNHLDTACHFHMEFLLQAQEQFL